MNKTPLEQNLNYKAIFKAGGANYGNEDYFLFCCPSCGHVYLLEYEVDTVFVDGTDLKKRFYPSKEKRFVCVSCEFKFARNGIWVGQNAPQNMVVNKNQLSESDWHWVVNENV